ncbi:MAG: TIGR04282 family arsenosugar biosynthesis glycosyltransferase, partial [bacterium]
HVEITFVLSSRYQPGQTGNDVFHSKNEMIGGAKIPLYLFAKAPVAGRVKTRMRPQISDRACAALAAEMLYQSVDKVVKHWPGKLVLCVTPSHKDPNFVEISKRYDCDVVEQIDAGLGDRMMHALDQGIRSAGAAAVMGCDVPQIPGMVLSEAGEHLQGGENVIGPALDGGFYLLGLQAARRELFEGIKWGEGAVLNGVLKRSEKIGMKFKLLETLRDIDRWADLKWLACILTQYAKYVESGADASDVNIS